MRRLHAPALHLRAWNAVNVSFAGEDTIDGNGKRWWACAEAPPPGCPHVPSCPAGGKPCPHCPSFKAPCNGVSRPNLVMMASVNDTRWGGPAAPATSLFNAVAESTDGGSTWRKPRFGIVRMHNSTANNIVYATPEQHGGAGDHSSDYMA